MVIDGLEYRFYNRRKDAIPERLASESFNDFIRRNGGGDILITGTVGYSGSKVHKFNASWIMLNGERLIISYYSICGSQRHGSGLAAFQEIAQVTCQKCGA